MHAFAQLPNQTISLLVGGKSGTHSVVVATVSGQFQQWPRPRGRFSSTARVTSFLDNPCARFSNQTGSGLGGLLLASRLFLTMSASSGTTLISPSTTTLSHHSQTPSAHSTNLTSGQQRRASQQHGTHTNHAAHGAHHAKRRTSTHSTHHTHAAGPNRRASDGNDSKRAKAAGLSMHVLDAAEDQVTEKGSLVREVGLIQGLHYAFAEFSAAETSSQGH